MKKSFGYFAAIWAVMLVVFNVVTFIGQELLNGMDLDGKFWICWSFIIATYLGQLACGAVALNVKNREKTFLNLPLINISFGALIAMTVAGTILMILPDLDPLVATLVCVIIFAFSLLSVLKAAAAADLVAGVDKKIKTQTFFIKSLAVDMETLSCRAQSEDVKAELTKVTEAVRYSDPMSNEALASVEAQINVTFAKLSGAVSGGDAETAKAMANEMLILINDRNRKCKLLK